jgi:hypothetical protein
MNWRVGLVAGTAGVFALVGVGCGGDDDSASSDQPAAAADPGGAASMVVVPAGLDRPVVEAAEDCPGECIFLEPDAP